MPQIAYSRYVPRAAALLGLIFPLFISAGHATEPQPSFWSSQPELIAAASPGAAQDIPYGATPGEYENGQYVPSIFRDANKPKRPPVILPGPPPIDYRSPQSAAYPMDTATSADTAVWAGNYRDGIYIIDKDYLLSYPQSLWRFATAPARFDQTDWLIAGGVVAATGAFFALDRSIKDFWQNNIRSGTSENISKVFDPFGNATVGFGVLFGAYALTEALDQTGAAHLRREKAAVLLSLESVLLSGGIEYGVKYMTGRDRPEKSSSPFSFNGPAKGSNTSFPSGHSTAAFAVASTVSEIYGDDYPWVPWVVYPIATGTGLTRIDRDKHWASDVFVGAALGYFVGKTVTRYNPFLEKHNMSLAPKTEDGEYSLSLIHRF